MMGSAKIATKLVAVWLNAWTRAEILGEVSKGIISYHERTDHCGADTRA